MAYSYIKLIVIISILLIILFIYFGYNVMFPSLANYNPVVVNRELVDLVMKSQHRRLLNLYYINLEISTDRKYRFLNRLNDNWNPIRIDAISPVTLPKIIDPPFMCSIVTNAEYACLVSHLKARHTAYINGDQYAIIAEDDAVIKYDIDWELLIHTAPKDWDVLQLHTCCISPLINKKSLSMHNSDEILWVHTDSIIPSAAFYIVSRNEMQKTLNRFIGEYNKPWEQINQIDLSSAKMLCHADLVLFDKVNRYICMQPLITTEKSKSTIGWLHDICMFNVQ